MTKTELMHWLREQQQRWEAFLDSIPPAQIDAPGVVGHWSIKDVIAHLVGWNRKLVAQMRAAQQGEPEPPLPWPAELEDEDAINAWHYETSRALSADALRAQANSVFEELIAVIAALPDDSRIDTEQPEPDRAYYLIWIGDERYLAGEFFHHFQDDHEAVIRAWLEQADQR
jgi:hypothetical protein